MTAKDETHLLSGAYALDALTPEEAQALEAAIRDSEELRGEVVGLVDTAVALGLAVPPASPPPALRAALLDAIEDAPQLPAEDDAPVTRPAEPALAAAAHVVPRRRRRLLRRPAVLLTAAAMAVLLFGGGVLVTRAVIEPQLEYSRVVAAADARQATVAVRGGGTATVSWSRSEGATAVALQGVAAPSGRVLQLWSLRGGTVTSLGLYERYELLHRLPSTGERLAVSVEPAGGSKQPTTEPIAVVGLGA